MKIYWQIQKKWKVKLKITAKTCITLRRLPLVLPTSGPIPHVLGCRLTSHFGDLKIPIGQNKQVPKELAALISPAFGLGLQVHFYPPINTLVNDSALAMSLLTWLWGYSSPAITKNGRKMKHDAEKARFSSDCVIFWKIGSPHGTHITSR